MARPLKKGLDYFNIDCNEEDNLAFVVSKHGLLAYAVIVKLWRKMYKIHGYYTEWTTKNLFLFADEVKIDRKVLLDILESCLEEGIFDRGKLQAHSILTSRGVQKRYLKIVTEAKRKDCHIEGVYSLIPGINPEETLVNSGGNPSFLHGKPQFPPEESTQRKVKESKVNEINTVSPAAAASEAPADEELEKGKKDRAARAFWQPFVDGWFKFYASKKNGEEPNFKGRNPAYLRTIYDLLEIRSKKRKKEWNESQAVGALNFFLEAAYEPYLTSKGKLDDWISEHFTLANLVEQFDIVFARLAEVKKPAIAAAPKGLDADLKYLQERYREPTFDKQSIDPELYDRMVSRNVLPVGSMQAVQGETIEEKKVGAVLAWLDQQNKLKTA